MNLGLGIGLGGRAGGPSGLNPALAASSATLAVYNWTSPSTMTAGDAGPVVQGDGDTIALVPNVKTPGTLDLGQVTAAFRPVYDNGPVFNGTDDFLSTAFASNAGPANATLVYALRTNDTQFMLGGTNDTSFFTGTAESGSGSSAHLTLTGNYFVGGSSLGTTRGDLFTGWGTNSPVVARIANVNFQNAAITSIQNSWGTSGFYFNGKCCLVAILNAGDGNYATALALAEAEASRIIAALGI